VVVPANLTLAVRQSPGRWQFQIALSIRHEIGGAQIQNGIVLRNGGNARQGIGRYIALLNVNGPLFQINARMTGRDPRDGSTMRVVYRQPTPNAIANNVGQVQGRLTAGSTNVESGRGTIKNHGSLQSDAPSIQTNDPPSGSGRNPDMIQDHLRTWDIWIGSDIILEQRWLNLHRGIAIPNIDAMTGMFQIHIDDLDRALTHGEDGFVGSTRPQNELRPGGILWCRWIQGCKSSRRRVGGMTGMPTCQPLLLLLLTPGTVRVGIVHGNIGIVHHVVVVVVVGIHGRQHVVVGHTDIIAHHHVRMVVVVHIGRIHGNDRRHGFAGGQVLGNLLTTRL